jgi:nucleoprotein TPR
VRQILQTLEAKAPMIKKLREERDKAEQQKIALMSQIEVAREQVSVLQDTELKLMLTDKDNTRLKRDLKDVSEQLARLLYVHERVREGLPVDQLDPPADDAHAQQV